MNRCELKDFKDISDFNVPVEWEDGVRFKEKFDNQSAKDPGYRTDIFRSISPYPIL